MFDVLSRDDLKKVMFTPSLVPTKCIKIPHKLTPNLNHYQIS